MRTTITILFFVAAAGCSLQNREGPNVACADLDNGLRNACAAGIIATCSAPKKITFHACKDENVCDAGWQSAGQYRCNQMDEMPTLRDQGTGATGPEPTGGSAVCGFSYSKADCASCIKSKCCSEATTCSGDEQCVSCLTRPASASPCASGVVANYEAVTVCTAVSCASDCDGVTVVADPGAAGTGETTGGSGGSSGAGGSAGSSGAGGSGGQATDGGTPACGVSEVCVIATTDSGYGVQGLALDAESVYFVDGCGAVKKTPKLGGSATNVADQVMGCRNQAAPLAVSSTHLFALTPSDQTVRVINLSDATDVTSFPDARGGVAADDGAGYWGKMQDLQRYTTSTKTLETFASGLFNGHGLSLGGTRLVWVSSDGATLYKLLKDAAASDAPASVSLSPTSATEIAVDGATVYFVDQNGGKLGMVDRDGVVSTILDGLPSPRLVAVNSTNIYWTDGAGLHSVPKAGGMARTRLTSTQGFITIVTDDEFVFVTSGNEVKRAPK